jgi:hypothetical protein
MSFNAQTGNIIEHRTYTVLGNQTSINVFHWFVASQVGLGSTEVNLGATLAGLFAGPYKALLTNQASYYGLGIQKVYPVPISTSFYLATGAGPGTAGINASGRQLAGFLKKSTNTADRHGRGRLYIPFPSTGDISALGQPTGAYFVRATALAVLYQTGFTAGAGGNTSDLIPCIFDRQTGFHIPITLVSAVQLWATQRRRGDFGRVNAPPF